jgi:hypothetical protein
MMATQPWGWLRCALLASLAAAAGGMVAPLAPAASRLLIARAPGLAPAVRMNIFEKAAKGAAGMVGNTLGKVAGMPEMSEAEQKAMEQAMLAGTLDFDQVPMPRRNETGARDMRAPRRCARLGSDACAPSRPIPPPSPQFLIQLKVITKAGSFAALAAKIPGAGDNIDPRAAALAEEKLRKYEKWIKMMDPAERSDPSLLLPSNPQSRGRVDKLAAAAGVKAEDIKQFLGEFVVMRKTSQAMAQGKSPEEVKAAMMDTQQDLGMTNRKERRLAAKEAGKKGKAKAKGGFGAKA